MNQVLLAFSGRDDLRNLYEFPILDQLTEDEVPGTGILPAQVMIAEVDTGAITWIAVENATGYWIQRQAPGDDIFTDLFSVIDAGSGELTHTNAGIIGPAYFRVLAYNAAGRGNPSEPLSLGDTGNETPP